MRTTHPQDIRSDPNAGYRFGLRRLMGWMLLLSIGLAVGTFLFRNVTKARQAAVDTSVQGQIYFLRFALLNYHDTYQSFPPAYIADANGKPMHSWRVLILPYIEQKSLYDQYDFNEPWNGPNNSKLHNQMPRSFRASSEPESNSITNFVLITGPGTAFPGSQSTSRSQFHDAEQVIFLTEITDSKINWLEPVDLNVEAGGLDLHGSGVHISAQHWRQPYVATDDRIHRVGRHVTEEQLRSLATIDGVEDVSIEDLKEKKLSQPEKHQIPSIK